jgi:hypothetical protein
LGEFVAYKLQIRDSEDQVKIRSPWAAALLPFITFGVYHLVWWYRINRELRDYGRAKGYDLGQRPAMSLLALFPGGIIIVPALVSYWRGTKRVRGASRVAGKDPISGWLALILFLVVSPGYSAYLQVSLNGLWRAEAVPLPGQKPLPPLGDDMPRRLDPKLSEPSSRSPEPPATAPGS